MELPQALIARLEAAIPVTAMTGTRIYWINRPQGDALPALVLQGVSENPTQHLKGFDDMTEARIQVACLAEKFSDSRLLAKAVKAALVPHATVVDPAGNDVLFWRAGVEGPRDLGNQEGTRFVHRAVVDFIIRYGAAA